MSVSAESGTDTTGEKQMDPCERNRYRIMTGKCRNITAGRRVAYAQDAVNEKRSMVFCATGAMRCIDPDRFPGKTTFSGQKGRPMEDAISAEPKVCMMVTAYAWNVMKHE